MIAKKDYYLDEKGRVTTDVNKGVRRLVRKGSTVNAVIEKRYEFADGEPTSKDPRPLVADVEATTTTDEPGESTAASKTESPGTKPSTVKKSSAPKKATRAGKNTKTKV